MYGLHETVKCKRNYSEYTLLYKSSRASKSKPAVLTATGTDIIDPQRKEKKKLEENCYIYEEGKIPPSRCMIYQVIFYLLFNLFKKFDYLNLLLLYLLI